MAVLRVQRLIQGRIAAFDPQQISVCPCIVPAAVGLFCLFPYTEGNAQGTVTDGFDFPNHVFHEINKAIVLPFPRLQCHRTVLLFITPAGHSDNIFLRRVKALHFFVAPADTAVTAVFNTAVGKFQQAPVIIHIAYPFLFYRISRGVKLVQFVGRGAAQKGNKVVFIQFFFV